MENTLYEINKHKSNILSLANKLISTYNINEETLINNEIKKETEFLLSLLNIKNSAMINQMTMNNNMNIFNPMMNPNFIDYSNQIQKLMQQQQMQMQQMMQQQQMQQEIPNNQPSQTLEVYFRLLDKQSLMVQCCFKDKISDIISIYRKYTLDNNENEKFIFNAKPLNTHLTVEEAGLEKGSNIFVVETEGVRGG